MKSLRLPVVRVFGLPFVLGACAPPAVTGPVALKGSSQTLVVQGEYKSIALDRVDSLSIDNGKVVMHGSSSNVTLDLPATTGTPEPVRHWALVTDAVAGSKRALTFTHETTLEDFTVELPASEAPIHYGVLQGQGGDDLMVIGWGTGSRSYSCYLSIHRASKGGDAH